MTTLRTSRSVRGDTPTDLGFRMISLATCRSLHGFTMLLKGRSAFSVHVERWSSQITHYTRTRSRFWPSRGYLPPGKAERQRAQSAQRLSTRNAGINGKVQSVAMMEAAMEQVAAKAHDLNLVLHLVASHHGHCRPVWRQRFLIPSPSTFHLGNTRAGRSARFALER